MKIKNIGHRAFIVNEADVIQGGEKKPGCTMKWINPDETVEMTEEAGEKLAKAYQEEIMVISRGRKKKEAVA